MNYSMALLCGFFFLSTVEALFRHQWWLSLYNLSGGLINVSVLFMNRA